MIEKITERKTFKGSLYIIIGTAILLYNFGLFQKIGFILAIIGAVGLIWYGIVIAEWHIPLYNAIDKVLNKNKK